MREKWMIYTCFITETCIMTQGRKCILELHKLVLNLQLTFREKSQCQVREMRVKNYKYSVMKIKKKKRRKKRKKQVILSKRYYIRFSTALLFKLLLISWLSTLFLVPMSASWRHVKTQTLALTLLLSSHCLCLLSRLFSAFLS